MARGLLPGALALSGKVMPAVTSVAHRTADALREFAHDPKVLCSLPMSGCLAEAPEPIHPACGGIMRSTGVAAVS